MKTNRVWIEIVLLGTAIACALALLFATLGAAAGVAVGEVSVEQQTPAITVQTYEGIVTCSRCGASILPPSVKQPQIAFGPVCTMVRPLRLSMPR
jgi:hypothetical protein